MDSTDRLFTIQQLSRKLNVPKPTLRYWENELKGLLVPLRSKGGQRRYTFEHVELIKQILFLKSQGYRLADIKVKLGQTHEHHHTIAPSIPIDSLADRIAQVVRLEIHRFFQSKDPMNNDSAMKQQEPVNDPITCTTTQMRIGRKEKQ